MRTFINLIISYIRRTDLLIWFMCIALSTLGIVLLAGILETGYGELLRISQRNIFVQSASVLLGICGAIVASLINYKTLAKLWKLHALICYGLLLLTFFIGVGAPGRPGDRRWLVFPGFGMTLQPAELLRVSFILTFAYHIFKIKDKINHPLHLLGLFLHGFAPVVLIHLQGDDGSALLFAAVFVCMLFCAGISWKYMLGAGVLMAASLPFVWFRVLSEFQRQRFSVLFGYRSAEEMQGIFFQQGRATLALAFGGMGGRGIFGDQHIYVPEMHNDFIFSFLGESMGLVGGILVIVVMAVLWIRILMCAGKSKDMLGNMICVGVFAMLFFQAAINIGMNISMLPVIGNNLPFVSYGGTSTLASYLGIGIVLSVFMHSSKSMFDKEE